MADAFRSPVGLPMPLVSSVAPGVNSFTLDQTTDRMEYVFATDDAVTITKVLIRQTTLTGTAPVFRVSLQGVNASGNPDGTIKGGATCFVDYTPTGGNNNTIQTLTLGASYACSRGEMLALVIAYQSGTIDGSNNCSFGSTINGSAALNFPYAIQNNAGARTRQNNNHPLFGYASSSRTYGKPIQTGTSLNVNTGSTPDEVGIIFTIPSGWCSTYKVLGVNLQQTMPAARVVRATLYDTDGTTVLQQVDRDTDAAASTTVRVHEIIFDEATLSTLTAGSTYRLSLAPQDATNQSFNYMEVAAAADWDAMAGGQNFYWTERTDAGAWTDRTTRKFMGELILADITKPTSGGLRFHPGVAGGFNA